jgi:hypothetical protein
MGLLLSYLKVVSSRGPDEHIGDVGAVKSLSENLTTLEAQARVHE